MMKRKLLNKGLLVLLTLIFAVSSAKAQSGWEEVYTTSTDAFMRDICFVPGTDGLWNTGWAIVSAGLVVKTTDGGDTWTEITVSESSSLSGISFADESIGYISTLDNKILKSVDGGVTWVEVYNGTVNFDKIEFRDTMNGVASGTQKLYTSDGGVTWLPGSGGSSYWYIDYASDDTYFGVNLGVGVGGTLGRSTDGGLTWTDIESIDDLAFCTEWYDDTHGYFGGDGSTVKVTIDGGASWLTHSLGDGQDAINCGDYFDIDTVYACASSGEIFKSTDTGLTWASDTVFSTGVFHPRGFVATGMNVLFSAANTTSGNGKVWRKIGLPPIDAEFEADQTEVCEGTTVNFTDMSVGNIDSWTWTFEGGTPSTSTDQNPSVTYSTPGTYYVTLVVAIGSLEDSNTKTDYINVFELPLQADEPFGETSVCTSTEHVFTTNEVAFAQEYDWELSDTDAGSLTWDMNEATLDVSDTYTGTFTLKVRATNVCGDGDWSNELSITSNESPNDFNLQGGGSYCLGGDGVEISLEGSQSGIDYELFLDGTTTGIVVSGTGSEISFGLQTDEGYYEAWGSNANCENPMTGQIQVFIEYPPVEPEAATGPITICEETTSDYTSAGSDDADSYVWEIMPEAAGTVVSTELDATVTWNSEFAGIAMITLYGMNDCGAGNSSEALEVSVGAPLPVIEGEEMVCDFSTEIYEVANNEGSVYTWIVTGGVIDEGQGTNMITVSWDGEGAGTISVEEETVGGCSGSSEEFMVLIDDCTGVDENSLGNGLSVFPNPAKEFVTIVSATEIYTLSVYSIRGELVETNEVQNREVTLKTSNYKSGIYFIRINTESGLMTKRLIVE